MTTNKTKRHWLFAFVIIIVFVIWMLEARSFYCLDNGICITVWKQLGNTCYVIPEKYYGMFPPVKNYFKITNTAALDIYYSDALPNILFVTDGENDSTNVVNDTNNKLQMYYLQYENQEKYRTYLVDENENLKNNVRMLTIDISENFLVREVR